MEDAYGNVGREFFVVADGLGGHVAGEVAAKLAVEAALKRFSKIKKKGRAPKAILTDVFKAANKAIIEEVRKNPFNFGMATTMIGAFVQKDNWWIGNIGDSRGYLFAGGQLRQITRDHEDFWGALTRVVGLEEEATPDIFRGKLKNGNILLLATDGLTDVTSETEIEEVLHTKDNVQARANHLVRLGLLKGGVDNITVCLIYREGLHVSFGF